MMAARLCGGEVQVSSLTSETTLVWAKPNGRMRAEQTAGPARFKDSSGAWRNVDLTLEQRLDGSVAPKAHPRGLVLSGAAGAGDHDIARTGSGAAAVALGWHGALPAPIIDGTTATYPEVKPGVDLVVQVTRTSFETFLVVKNRQAAASVAKVGMPWTLPALTQAGMSLSTNADRGLSIKDAKGKITGSIPAAEMWDATVDPHSGEHTHRAVAGLSMAATKGSAKDLVISPDTAFLNNPNTVFPVTIDPAPENLTAYFDTFIQSDTTSDQSGVNELRIGTSDGGTTVDRSVIDWSNVGYLAGSVVSKADLYLWNFYSASCTTAWNAYRIQYVNGTVRWSNQPSIAGMTPTTSTDAHGNACAADWSKISVIDSFQNTANGGSSTVNVELRAASETDNSYWKRFSSLEAPAQPVVQLEYDYRPVIGTTTTTPSVPCVTGSGRPYINSATPTLSAAVTDAEGSASALTFEWWATGGSSPIRSVTTSAVPSGQTGSVAVNAGDFTDGNTYSWRVKANDGAVDSAWSPFCEFTVDTTIPSATPGVSGSPYTAGAWNGAAGTAGTFTFTASGVTDVASYLYGLDQNPPTTSVNAASLGGSASVSITPTTSGPHTLSVASVDRAGNTSAVSSYAFDVGVGGLLSPTSGTLSAGKLAVAPIGQTSATGVTLQWRRGDADSWATIPAADVTYTVGGSAVSSWPVASTGSGGFPAFTWNIESTVNAAEAGPDALDGPVQIRPSFTGTSGTADPVKVTLDRNRALGASTAIGPGSVNLVTGNMSVASVDVSAFNLGVIRTFNSRQAGAADAMFGPGWNSSVAVASADAGYTDLTVTGSLVQIGLPDGSTLGFAKETGTSSSATFDPQTGSEGTSLTWSSTGDVYTLVDKAGNMVTFTHLSSAAAGVYQPSAATPVGSAESSTYAWEKVTIGGTDVIRPTRVLAPVAAGITCTTTLVIGCRALTFTYASTTTATGTDSGTWGDYLGRVSEVDFVAWNPDASPAAMTTVAVHRYTYDSTGVLRAAWDPRLDYTDGSGSHHVQTTYSYGSGGVLTGVTPPGQASWSLAYTTIPGDAGAGRLASVSRTDPAIGSPSVSTVVYKVPLSGSGAPNDMSAGQTSRWNEPAPPVDATAVFPPSQIPGGNQATGVLPLDFSFATVTYMDGNARTVNTAQPGGGIDSTWYDSFGNVQFTLTAANRVQALSFQGATPAQTAYLSALLSTGNIYSSDGTMVTDTYEPERTVIRNDGSQLRGRPHTHTTYDEGAPSGGPYRLPTTVTNTIMTYDPDGWYRDHDPRVTTTTYDWTLRAPTAQTVDPGGLALTTRTSYDPATTQVASTTGPAGGTTTNTPATRLTIYYTTAANSTYPDCGGHPEWAELVCRYQPGGQPASGPALAGTRLTYDMYGQQRTSVESTSSTTLRTTTTTYDGAGRQSTVAITVGSGLGAPVSATRQIYDPATGLPTRTQTLDGNGNVTAELVRAYDTLGRITSYTDADGNVATTTYDLAGRVATTNDGKATRTYTYDGGTERRGLPTQVVDSHLGTFTATYDLSGQPATKTYPDGMVVNITANEAGQPTSIVYTLPNCGLSDCTMFSQSRTPSAAGDVVNQSSTLSYQHYSYDNALRVTQVQDAVFFACETRTYSFNAASDRTGFADYAANPDGSCQSSTASSSRSYTYDSADRITTTGTVYDALGRTTTQPAVDTSVRANGDATMAYYANDMAASITQNGRTTVYTLDVATNRTRSWTDNAAGTTITRTNHYAGDTDNPAWTNEGGGNWTRPAQAVAGLAAIEHGPTSSVTWLIVNLHGDVTATIEGSATGLSTVTEYSEYGTPKDPSQIGGSRYGWLGSEQRAADTPGGAVLMGARIYEPSTGRFASVDPVYGGNANLYDYCSGDGVNCTDTTGALSWGRYGFFYNRSGIHTWWGSWTWQSSWGFSFWIRLTHTNTTDLLFGTRWAMAAIVAAIGAVAGPWGAAGGAIVGYAIGDGLTYMYQRQCHAQNGVTFYGGVKFFGSTWIPMSLFAFPVCNW